VALLASRFLPVNQDTAGALAWRAQADTHPSQTLAAAEQGPPALVGFDVDATDLETAPVLRVRLYWQVDTRPGEVGVQSLVVRNLVANAALATTYTPPGVQPFGFPHSIYGPGLSVSVEPVAGRDHAVCLARPPSGQGAGLEGLAYGLRPGVATLVQGGDVISPDGSGFAIGRRWASGQADQSYSYVASGPVGPSGWTTYAGLAAVPPEAQAVRLWLQNNYGPSGARTCFDRLYLFELPAPPDVGGDAARS
jgi:hypothetical protein